ncbi:MAG: CDP-glycerol glycerophosphotransferase family protein, partial [Clostridia bacterium]|nr:CDP-glycerol glycerophosphotransferase family protein [Clostridia bacterium]
SGHRFSIKNDNTATKNNNWYYHYIPDAKFKNIGKGVVVNDLNTDLPKEIKKVKYGSLKHYYHLITARLWVDNVRSGLKPPFKRKKQFYLQTWHGRSYLKCVEKDVEEFLDSGYVLKAKQDGKLSDFIISGSEHQTKVIKRAFWFNGEILKTGLPRDDALFKDNRKDIEDLKQKFNLKDKKIILYAPSFRTTNSFYENLNLDANEFIKVFNKKFGGEHVFCLRLHPNDASRKDLKIKNCIDLTSVPDSQLVLSCSDYIISDYSGMLFDGLMLNKFSFGFAPDYYDYIKKERHLYIDFKDLPFPYELNTTDLLEKIKNLDIKKYKKEVELYNKNYGFYDNKNSSKKVKEFLQKNNIV